MNPLAVLVPSLAVSALLPAPVPPRAAAYLDDGVAGVATRYHDAMFDRRDLDAAFALTGADVAFVDPTAEVWGGPAAVGVRGKETLLGLVRSWQLESSTFHVARRFASGEHAVLAGTLDWKAAGRPKVEGVPFCTILRVRDGAVVERRDYGDYDRLTPPLGDGAQELERRARAYFDAWRALDADDLAALVTPDFAFVDATAAPAGEAASTEGRTAFLERVGRTAARVDGLAEDAPFAFFSGRHALFLGTASYALPDAAGGDPRRVAHDVLTVLTLAADGRVVEHRRWVDYDALSGADRADPSAVPG